MSESSTAPLKAVTPKRKVVLVCIDGWGITSDVKGNAVLAADTPIMDAFAADKDRYCEAAAHGLHAGLPEGLMGNSEVGHLTIGAGRVQFQDLVRINLDIKTGAFKKRPALTDAFTRAISGNGRFHFAGLVSDGGVHSHINHLKQLLVAAKEAGVPKAFVHFFADGRDTPPNSGVIYIEQLQSFMKEINYGAIATVTGRYYAMDRDKRWERIEIAYNALLKGDGETSSKEGLIETVKKRYSMDESDEFLKPIIVDNDGLIIDDDTLLFIDFRADRMREIVETIGVSPPFDTSIQVNNLHVVQFTQYKSTFPLPIVFPPQSMDNTLSEWLSKLGMKQFHTAETEKYAHVTFFFNGGREQPFDNECRDMVPSPQCATYDLEPTMNLKGVTNSVNEAIASNEYAFIVCNLAPPDMVGHTGKFDEAVLAVAATDTAIGKMYEACKQYGYVFVVTSDHGNAEVMIDENGIPKTSHTANPVPLAFAGDDSFKIDARDLVGLHDIAPTILSLMGLPIPDQMTGRSIISA